MTGNIHHLPKACFIVDDAAVMRKLTPPFMDALGFVHLVTQDSLLGKLGLLGLMAPAVCGGAHEEY